MIRLQRHPILVLAGSVAMLALLIVVGLGVYLAGEAGELPWQTDPTRIAITPFAGIEGFSAPTAVPTAVPTPAS